MKAEELMIGDWVRSKLHNVDTQIDCVGREPGWKSDFYCVWLTSKECWERHYLDEIEPIPLTPEILKKNGFVLTDEKDKHYRLDIKESVFINADFKADDPWVCINNGCYQAIPVCRYVHELQRALKVCGIYMDFKV